MDDKNLKMYTKEEGCGYYSKINKFAFESQKVMLQLLKKLFQGPLRKLQSEKTPFTVADFGTADGASFITSVPAIIDFIRSLCGSEKQISILFNDGPENDFKTVFRHFADAGGMNANNTAFDQYRGVFVTVCGKSFYNQCLPDKSLSLGCSTTALHFLSKVPGLIEECSSTLLDEMKAEPFRKQAEVDWEQFLLIRAKELKSGGALCLMVIGKDEQGRYPGVTRPGTTSIYKLLSDTWRHFYMTSWITKNELLNSTFPMHIRTQEELLKPFTRSSSVLEAGLRLYDMSVVEECPYYKKYQYDIHNKDAAEDTSTLNYAVDLSRSIKSWSYFLFYNGLSTSRTVKEREEIMDQYYDDLAKTVIQNPNAYIFDYVYNCMLILKD